MRCNLAVQRGKNTLVQVLGSIQVLSSESTGKTMDRKQVRCAEARKIQPVTGQRTYLDRIASPPLLSRLLELDSSFDISISTSEIKSQPIPARYSSAVCGAYVTNVSVCSALRRLKLGSPAPQLSISLGERVWAWAFWYVAVRYLDSLSR
jgi:hypothetical protein